MEIETIKTAELILYAQNSRTHSAEQVAQIANSIKEFGFTNPVLIDSDNGIIAGHGRVMAAQSVGLDLVPCIRLSHLTDAQKRAYVIADNQLALNSGWDVDILKEELHALQSLDFELDVIGFDAEELGDLFKDVETTKIQQLDKRLGDMTKGRVTIECAVKDVIDLINDLQGLAQKYNAVIKADE